MIRRFLDPDHRPTFWETMVLALVLGIFLGITAAAAHLAGVVE